MFKREPKPEPTYEERLQAVTDARKILSGNPFTVPAPESLIKLADYLLRGK